MRLPFLTVVGLLMSLSLVAICFDGVLLLYVTAESIHSVRGILLAICGLLVALLSIAAYVSLREDRRRNQTDENLRNSESRIRAILETAVDAVIAIDERGRVESINAAAERMFGYSRSEIIGRNVNLLMPSPEREAHDGYLANYLKTGERRIIGVGREVVCRRKDGTEFSADLAVGEYRVENQRRFTGFLRDITERKRSEARIREQAALLDKARDAIVVRDLDDRITFWNPAAERLYGWSAAEACGHTGRELLFEGEGAQLEPAKRALLDGDEWVGELRNTTRDGREVIIESRWSLLRDERNRPVEILAIEADITDRKERERQALRAQRLESIGTLAGGIAHDLNNMLTPILISAKLLKKDRPAAERDHLIDNILASAERGAEMIKQLLSFTGGVDTERTHVDLRAVVREIKSLLEHTLSKSISLHTEVAADLWPISGDATQLAQVLMNLCVNARDAMPEGGALAIHGENRRLDEDFTATVPDLTPGPYVVLSVIDTGSGIPPDVIDRVFDPFFTTKEIGKGTGLGLSTVLGIVKSHGGTIRISSLPGSGSTFTVFLPTIEAGEVSRAQPKSTVLPPDPGKRILVIDDESFILTAVRATLEDAGYQVIAAHDGAEAIALFREHPAELDAVIVDMMMPGMDGPATIRALRDISPKIRIVASSGLRTADDAAKLIEGISAFLQKPYTGEQLLTTMSRVLREEAPG